MLSSDASIIEITTEPPRQSKRSKSKEPRTYARKFASLKDHMGSLEDTVARIE